MAELLEVKELDANLKNNNAEAQAKAEETHRRLNILRNEYQSVQKDVHELENEVTTNSIHLQQKKKIMHVNIIFPIFGNS